MNCVSRAPESKGFTLIELLTVIAIIGILAGILIPVVGKVRESAKTAMCINNVRQLTLAIINFGDEMGTLPTAASLGSDPDRPEDWVWWQDLRGRPVTDSPIAAHVGGTIAPELFRCPLDDEWQERNYTFSYALNGLVAGNSANLGYGNSGLNGKYEAIPDPSKVIILVDEESPDDGHFKFTSNEVSTRHGGQGPAGFADTHVELVTHDYAVDWGLFTPFEGPVVSGRTAPR